MLMVIFLMGNRDKAAESSWLARRTPLVKLYGRFPTLPDVVTRYDQCFSSGLTDQEKPDLVPYLLSLPSEE